MHERFELRRQHHEDNDQRQGEREVERAPALLQLSRFSSQLDRAARREHVSRYAGERVERLTEGEPGRETGAERERANAIEVVERLRADGLIHSGNSAELHEPAVAAA